MSIVHGTLKGGICKLCLTGFENIFSIRNQSLLLGADTKINCLWNQRKRGSSICLYIAALFLVFVTKYFVFKRKKTKKDCVKAWSILVSFTNRPIDYI